MRLARDIHGGTMPPRASACSLLCVAAAMIAASVPASGAVPHRSPPDEEALVWRSPEECARVVKAGGRMAVRSPDVLRVGTWNIRWFPSGGPPDRPEHRQSGTTDPAWLTCALVWMQPDILVVQESLTTDHARESWARVLQDLARRTGERWQWSVQRCGKPDRHHVGMLWNASRTTLSGIRSLWRVNAQADSARHPCKGGRRPGHYAYVRSTHASGADFHLIGLHLKSGTAPADVEERRRALRRLDAAVAPLTDADPDIIILGDLNTMGAGNARSRRLAVHHLRHLAAALDPGLRVLLPKPRCSHYFRKRAGWLDHVLVAEDMTEMRARTARMTGYCAVAGCRRIHGEYPPAYQRLSDHCPMMIEIRDRDMDPGP